MRTNISAFPYIYFFYLFESILLYFAGINIAKSNNIHGDISLEINSEY